MGRDYTGVVPLQESFGSSLILIDFHRFYDDDDDDDDDGDDAEDWKNETDHLTRSTLGEVGG